MCVPAVTYRSGLMYCLYAVLVHRPMALIVLVGTLALAAEVAVPI